MQYLNMCGRYNLTSPLKDIIQLFGLDANVSLDNIVPSYNIAPGQDVPIVRSPESGKELTAARWGLVPHWSKTSTTQYSTINARAETVANKPAYREPFKHKRCLIPANGFYEWQKLERGKVPHHIGMRDGSLFAFAGLWDHWEGEGVSFISCSIIVTTANNLIKPIHDRMPVILAPSEYDQWLDFSVTDKDELLTYLRPFSNTPMRAYPISTFVNSARNNSSDCIKPAMHIP